MLKNFSGLLPIFTIYLLLTGCPYGDRKYEQGQFPIHPVNFEAANSVFDDYNSTSPVIEGERYLYFSSNRNSSGNDFDIVGSHLRIYWDKSEGTLEISDKPSSWRDYSYTDTLFARMNTEFDEFGPYSVNYYRYDNNYSEYIDVIVFANDESGNLDLKFVAYTGQEILKSRESGSYIGPEPLAFLNSQYNDAYLTFYGPYFIWNGYDKMPANITELLFCSDRDGDYDIYYMNAPNEPDLIAYLQSNMYEPIYSATLLNSPSQDKCPYVEGNLLVFASDRPGGYGGFDLYYSRRNGEKWSEPINFGERINSEFDEYRPIVMSNYEFVNDLMIFSSDRPGGKGGFDLYYVGIPKLMY